LEPLCFFLQHRPQEDERDRRRTVLSRAATLRRKQDDLDLEQQKWEGQDARCAQFETSLKTIEEQIHRAEAKRDSAFRDAEAQQNRERQENEEKWDAKFQGEGVCA